MGKEIRTSTIVGDIYKNGTAIWVNGECYETKSIKIVEAGDFDYTDIETSLMPQKHFQELDEIFQSSINHALKYTAIKDMPDAVKRHNSGTIKVVEKGNGLYEVLTWQRGGCEVVFRFRII